VIEKLSRYFLRGLLILVPVVVTGYVVYLVFHTIDGWVNLERLLNRRVPGAGIVVTLAVILLTGVLASHFTTRWLFRLLDAAIGRLPLVRLLYTSIKDFTGAFVGEQKRFDKPVMVAASADGELSVVGFETRAELSELGLPNHAAVYVPQSYNFAGNLIVVPRTRVRPLSADATEVMAFIVSGGVSGSTANSSGRRPEIPRETP